VLNAWVEPFKLSEFVQGSIAIIGHQLIHSALDVYDVHKISVPVQFRSLELDLNSVMMRMELVFRSPVSSKEKVSSHKVSLHSDGIERISLIRVH
jgi:hypothetical protein